MPSNPESISQAEKLKALRQIQSALDQVGHPTVRACGLTEKQFEVLADEELIEVTFVADEGPTLDRYYVESILPKGSAILVQDDASDAPLRVQIYTPKLSIWSRIFRKTRSGLWDLIKVAFGAVVGWFLKTYFS